MEDVTNLLKALLEVDFSDILSIIAIIFSICTAKQTDKLSKEITNKTLKKDYFDEIFKDFMLKTFPVEIMEKIKWKETSVSNEVYEVEPIIMGFLKKANAYRYLDLSFFQELYQKLSLLDECIFELIDMRENEKLTQQNYEIVRTKIDNLAEELYQLLKEQYEC